MLLLITTMKFYFAAIYIFMCSITITFESDTQSKETEIDVDKLENSWKCASTVRNVIPYYNNLIRKRPADLEEINEYKYDIIFLIHHKSFHDYNWKYGGRNLVQKYLLEDGISIVQQDHELLVDLVSTTIFDKTAGNNKKTTQTKQPTIDELTLFEIYVWFLHTIDTIDISELVNPGLREWKNLINILNKEGISIPHAAFLITELTDMANEVHREHDLSDMPMSLNHLAGCLKYVERVGITTTPRPSRVKFNRKVFTLQSSAKPSSTSSWTWKWNMKQLRLGFRYTGDNRPANIPSKKSVEEFLRCRLPQENIDDN